MSAWKGKDRRTLKRRSMGHVDRKDPLREYNVPGEQLSLQLHAFFASFIRFFIFPFYFPFFFFCIFLLVLSSNFLPFFLKARFAAILVHSIRTRFDASTLWRSNQRPCREHEIFFSLIETLNQRTIDHQRTFTHFCYNFLLHWKTQWICKPILPRDRTRLKI